MSRARALLLLGVGASIAVAGCGDTRLVPLVDGSAASAGLGSGGASGGADANGGSNPTAGLGPAGGTAGGSACPECGIFPNQPVIVAPLPSDIAARFGPAGSGTPSGGPCLTEPESGSLFPRNWLPPRFSWSAFAARTAIEIRVHVDAEANDLVVYTPDSPWTLDAAMWTALASEDSEHAVEISTRSLNLDDPKSVPALGSKATITIASADAPGTIAYNAAGSAIRGFRTGTADVITIQQAAAGRCLACHTGTPGNTFIAYSEAAASDLPDGQAGSLLLRLARDRVTEATAVSSPTGLALTARASQHQATFSGAHWAAGDFRVISLYRQQLIWTDLDAASTDMNVGWGPLARTGDLGQVASGPQWSHDGTFVLYASGSGTDAGGIISEGDLYRVPYGAGQGGTATPISGASDDAWNEYYPSLSPDDRQIAYARAPKEQTSFHNAAAEIFVVPVAGGTPQRLAANDPSACLGTRSPGVTNSWPRWAPAATVTNGRTFYWLAFSSTRGDGKLAQIYVTPVVVDRTGAVSTYPAIRLWNQSAGEANYGPSWTSLQLPPG